MRKRQETDAAHGHASDAGHTATSFRTTLIRLTPLRPAERNEHRMGIADLVVTSAKVRRGPPCSVCEVLGRLPQDEQDALVRLLSDHTVRYTELSASLAQPDIGLDLSAGTLSRHARGRCEAREKLR